MIPGPFLLMILLLAAVFSLTALFLSPAIIELKKPKDKGPRRIRKTSLERRIMKVGREPFIVKLDPKEPSDGDADLKNALDEAGEKAACIGSDALHIFGSHIFPSHSVLSVDIVVEGCLKIGDDCVFHRSVKARDRVLVGNRVTIEGNLVSEKDVTILDDVVIGGSVHSEGSVTIGEKTFVALSVVAVGDVEVGENSEIIGGVFTRGAVKGPRQARVELPSSINEID